LLSTRKHCGYPIGIQIPVGTPNRDILTGFEYVCLEVEARFFLTYLTGVVIDHPSPTTVAAIAVGKQAPLHDFASLQTVDETQSALAAPPFDADMPRRIKRSHQIITLARLPLGVDLDTRTLKVDPSHIVTYTCTIHWMKCPPPKFLLNH